MEKHSDLWKVIRTVFLVVGAIVVIGGIVYAVLKFLEPKEDDEYSSFGRTMTRTMRKTIRMIRTSPKNLTRSSKVHEKRRHH